MRPPPPPYRHSLGSTRSRVLDWSDDQLLARFRELDALERPMDDAEREEYSRLVDELRRRSSSRLHGQNTSAPIWSQILRDVDVDPQV